MYSVKQLEKLTNIKAHTIRIWEHRYNLITPERSSTNIRLYSDDDLKRLLNVCTLMEMGMKISQISKLDGSQISEQIEKLIAL